VVVSVAELIRPNDESPWIRWGGDVPRSGDGQPMVPGGAGGSVTPSETIRGGMPVVLNVRAIARRGDEK
jgi:hypothetical protein